MGTSKYNDDFKRAAVHQTTFRGYPRSVTRVSAMPI